MMISPDFFAEERKNLSYPELIRERDELISFMQDFEKQKGVAFFLIYYSLLMPLKDITL